MLPGHDFGNLGAQASNGNTGVFVNGRQLPVSEYTVWSSIVGNWIQYGRYWLDAKGNAGYEGTPIPVINLYAAVQQNAYQGKAAPAIILGHPDSSPGTAMRITPRGMSACPDMDRSGTGFNLPHQGKMSLVSRFADFHLRRKR